MVISGYLLSLVGIGGYPFSKELTDNYCALGLLFESIICNNNWWLSVGLGGLGEHGTNTNTD